MRYLYGENEPILIPVASAQVVEIGDSIAIVSNLAVPVSIVADAGDAAANREAGAVAFAGIADNASPAGDTKPVRVGTAGVYLLTQKAAAAIHVGDQVGIYASADACEAQTVVEDATSPIGVCVEEDTVGGDIKVKIIPALFNKINAA